MTLFSEPVIDFWQEPLRNGTLLYRGNDFRVVIHADLEEDRRVMTLEDANHHVTAMLTPAIANQLGLALYPYLSEAIFLGLLKDAGMLLHEADYIFYFSETEKRKLLQERVTGHIRRLTNDDQAVFSSFQSSATEEDLDSAYVELDHWTVFGSFEQHQLVCAASMYPWKNAQIADLGILTLAPFRGLGHARKLVRSICKSAFEQGYEPQYRCQTDHTASISLAKAAGLTLFGSWKVISPDSLV